MTDEQRQSVCIWAKEATNELCNLPEDAFRKDWEEVIERHMLAAVCAMLSAERRNAITVADLRAFEKRMTETLDRLGSPAKAGA